MKRTKGYILTLVILATFTLGGCQAISQADLNKKYISKEKAEQQLEDAKADFVLAVAKKNKEIEAEYDAKIAALMKQMQGGANSLYGANEGFKYYEKPTRLDLIINNRVTEAQAALGVAPTYEAVIAENARLKDELDEKKTTIEQLRKTHEDAVAKNAKLVDETKKISDELEQKKKDLQQLNADFNAKKDALDKQIKELDNKIIAKEHERADDKASQERLKRQLMLWTGIGAVIATIGAIYSPVGKRGLIILAATLGAATAAIPFIEGWMILTGVLGIVGVVIAKYLYDHHVTDKTNDNLINAIEDTKKTPNATADTLSENLKLWNAKYVKKSGILQLAEDNSVEKLIETKLLKFGRLDVDKPTSGSL